MTGWRVHSWVLMSKGYDERKVLLAALLWERTVVSQEWLAEILRMKSAANVSQQMKRLDRKRALDKVPETCMRR